MKTAKAMEKEKQPVADSATYQVSDQLLAATSTTADGTVNQSESTTSAGHTNQCASGKITYREILIPCPAIERSRLQPTHLCGKLHNYHMFT